MVPLEQVEHRLRSWAEEFRQDPPAQVEKGLVHKHRQENVFVARSEPVGEEGSGHFIGQLFFPTDHVFFFEHPLDHVPGLMMIEAGRQFGNVVAHRYYDVPHDTIFILNGIEVEFSKFAELDKPVFVNSKVSDTQFKRGRLTAMTYGGHFVQDLEPIGSMTGRWNIYDRRVMERMRRAAGATVGSAQD